VIERTQSLAF